jgi:ankyrin repeat protein
MNLSSVSINEALVKSIESGNINQMEYLISLGADLLLPDMYGETPLVKAAEIGNEMVVDKLLVLGSPPDSCYGASPLYLATKKGHIQVVKCLIMAGSKVDWQHENGLTPLMEASSVGYFELVQLLIESGADLSIVDDHDCKAITYASFNGYVEIVNYLGRFSSKDELEEAIYEATEGKGAKVRKKREGRVSKLYNAVKTNNLTELELVLKLGIDVNTKDNAGKTALNYARENQYLKVIELLLNFGARES